MIWFIFTKASLADEGGVERFFRSWGGEARYNSHESNKLTGPALRIPGIPSIVEAAVPCGAVETFMDVGKRFVNVWCAHHGIETGVGAEFEGYVQTSIPGTAILRVNRLGDERFCVLTNHSEWDTPL